MASPDIHAYLKAVAGRLRHGGATEHSYRGDLETLMRALLPGVAITNEPSRVECGAPDYVLTRNTIPLGYIEAKDVDKSLDDRAHREQLQRYLRSLDNFAFTNYLEFRFYRDNETKPVADIAIAELRDGKIKPLPQNFAQFSDLVENFGAYQGRTITAADGLAQRMANKARMLARVIAEALTADEKNDGGVSEEDSALRDQLKAFRETLIADIEPAEFADIYAQTVAYGMFAARLHDPTPATFTRQEAAELIPKSNPFLRNLFQHIAGYELDSRIRWIVDDLADVFRASAVHELMKAYGKATQRNDPFLHFYETFLGAYDAKLRKSRGVWYTPEPVVNFIARAVDAILKKEFGLRRGLADSEKITVGGKPTHRVQILDPAAGTGTFLANIVKHIHESFHGQRGAWPDYARDDLIPRLHGFEILMAPYAMAHVKLEMILNETGCKLRDGQRLRVFLTDSLENRAAKGQTREFPFARWIANEAKGADQVKRDTPVMVVVGNPPYSGESVNKGEWITGLMDAYKREPGGGRLKEKNAKWINDDYVKFIRCGQHFIDRTGYGVLAYINNHSFLDNPTFRGMRWSLMQSFDAIYIIDLHGNSKKKEVSPDGSPDKNVFDIQQGVSINLFVKARAKKNNRAARVFHHDCYGERESKYQFLWGNELRQVDFAELKPQAPQYFFVPKDYELQGEYEQGFSVNDLFPVNSVGIVTARDAFTIYHTPQDLKAAIARFRAMDDETARTEFSLGRDARDWKVSLARKDMEENIFAGNNDEPVPICYRPFDVRHTYYTGNSKGFHCMPRGEVMRHFLGGENVGLITSRITKDDFSVLCTKHIAAHKSATLYDISYIFPLYRYPDEKQTRLGGETSRNPNLNADIVKTIAETLGLRFTPEKTDAAGTFAPLDLLDYIYAVLHSP
ncbi:MAG: N-6 DNA methylase, partial [Gammaproteobacteria bacterium]|nr:N-6 DNA methylase [Gammaproteobacteria bacterium]